jgi:hypothetical protein
MTWRQTLCKLFCLVASSFVVATVSSAANVSAWPECTDQKMPTASVSPAPPNASTSGNAQTGKSLGQHYLLLVNTAIARLLKPADFAEFERSPYDGLAIAFHYNYDTAPVFSSAMMTAQLLDWKKLTKKDLWPWIYFNRMVGAGEAATNERTNVPYFHKIQGIDLEDKAGARSDFLQIMGNALHTAKDTKAPGIVLDLEFYNYHKEYDPAEMAAQTGKSVSQVVELLKQLGARMADSTAQVYPGAVIWMPFTGFTHKDFKQIGNDSYYPTPVYIAIGLLDQIKKRNYPITVISGGEGSIGYCHADINEFQDSIRKRAAIFAPILQNYPGILELAGTMTVWNERAGKSGFIAESECAKASASTVEELQPYLELLLKTYRYNWIYGSSNGSYFAFDPRSAPRFNAVISSARTKVEGWKPH